MYFNNSIEFFFRMGKSPMKGGNRKGGGNAGGGAASSGGGNRNTESSEISESEEEEIPVKGDNTIFLKKYFCLF